ncbi:DUF2314 domain-containing protein (plasmid) [Methylobacterium sp. NMS12]|uniref:YegJ family protein n=1 Tax=Methylobacterium sp. NMS12 TaxID=3079766 RepID=UPI003F881774
MRRSTISAGLLGAIVVAAAAAAQPVYDTSRRGGTVEVLTDDPAMEAAKARGRATLPEFLATVAAPQPGQSDFAVKVGFTGRTREGAARVEYFWVTPFTIRGERITGVLGNRPVYATQLRAGQRVSFGRDEVVDWNYREDGIMRGNFTGCAVLRKSSAEDRARFRATMGLDCGP